MNKLISLIILTLFFIPSVFATNFYNSIGGTVTYDGLYTVVTFLNNGTFNVTGTIPNAIVLVVAGGGGGGRYYSGGGGAGGLLYNTSYNLTGNMNAVVGVGGIACTSSGGCTGANGQNSSFGVMTAVGGGGAGGHSVAGVNGNNGGSGGGGGGSSTGDPGTGISGQGNNGGYTNGGGGAGGGGAGNIGLDKGVSGGNGGYGLNYSINGTLVSYAGGGGGSKWTAGVGGYGGGGNGATDSVAAQSGTNGTGGGGGGGSSPQVAGSGGSGIVIIRYLTFTPTKLEVTSVNLCNNTSCETLGVPVKGTIFNCSAVANFLYLTINQEINFSFYVNGTLIQTAIASDVESNITTYSPIMISGLNKSDTIFCGAIAFNGTNYSTQFNSTSYTLNNTSPIITSIISSNESSYYNTSVLTCSGTYNDVDEDTQGTQRYRWFLNGSSLLNTTKSITYIDSGFNISDNIICEHISEDSGYDIKNSSRVNSSPIIITTDLCLNVICTLPPANCSGYNYCTYSNMFCDYSDGLCHGTSSCSLTENRCGNYKLLPATKSIQDLGTFFGSAFGIFLMILIPLLLLVGIPAIMLAIVYIIYKFLTEGGFENLSGFTLNRKGTSFMGTTKSKGFETKSQGGFFKDTNTKGYDFKGNRPSGQFTKTPDKKWK